MSFTKVQGQGNVREAQEKTQRVIRHDKRSEERRKSRETEGHTGKEEEEIFKFGLTNVKKGP